MHRVSRMAAAGASPSARDQAEFMRMSSEKVAAFYRSWAGMWAAAFAAQFQLARAVSSAALAAAQSGQASALALTAASGASAKVLAAGLSPVHRTAVANARRLRRSRR